MLLYTSSGLLYFRCNSAISSWNKPLTTCSRASMRRRWKFGVGTWSIKPTVSKRNLMIGRWAMSHATYIPEAALTMPAIDASNAVAPLPQMAGRLIMSVHCHTIHSMKRIMLRKEVSADAMSTVHRLRVTVLMRLKPLGGQEAPASLLAAELMFSAKYAMDHSKLMMDVAHCVAREPFPPPKRSRLAGAWSLELAAMPLNSPMKPSRKSSLSESRRSSGMRPAFLSSWR
mmetsp:Transcript_20267/g.60721  ORF Transcript_20267/g.60721 Transcript_20267/m.60721 type:complete len:229 (+) Transcript_20267:61-747(+)